VTLSPNSRSWVRMLVIVFALSATVATAASAADAGAQPAAPATAPAAQQPSEQASTKCLEATVNPVTGFAVCTNPPGAPVAAPPPPAEPCKPRAHDNETGTVYEHWSAC
jgi:hypothetical protein